MTMNFKHHVIKYVIYIVTLCGKKMIELEKYNNNVPGNDKWEIPTCIPLMPIVGVNYRLPILHMSKIMVYCYTTGKTINQFAIGYIISPSLNFYNAFRTQVEKCLSVYFSARTMQTIKNCLMKKNTCVMELIMIYENSGEIPKKLYKVLSVLFILSYTIMLVLTICRVNQKP